MKTKLIFAAAACVLGMASASNAVTIINGSFETQSPKFIGGYTTLGTTSTDLTGWTIDSGNIDLINTYWNAQDGNYSVDMDGGVAGTISQTVTGLVSGAFYQVSFWLAGNPDTRYDKTISAGTDEGSSAFTFLQAGHFAGSMGWQLFSFNFQAASTSTKLTFASLTPEAWGPALDNVSITTVPLPAGAPLLLVGVAGVAALRRRKSV